MHNDSITVISLREPRERVDGAAVRELLTRAVTDGSWHWQRLQEQWDVLRCEHEGRDGSGTTGVDSKNRLRGPWEGSSDVDVALAAGEAVEQKVYIPFELVTPANVADYAAKN